MELEAVFFGHVKQNPGSSFLAQVPSDGLDFKVFHFNGKALFDESRPFFTFPAAPFTDIPCDVAKIQCGKMAININWSKDGFLIVMPEIYIII
jgi:hypothetical protein